ncbi:hypothetical protein KAZ01_02445 [Candidatus Gracilibacteria bacterium]|nr:hypothetical protein [Candidatus Gracilibacteria bacterium]
MVDKAKNPTNEGSQNTGKEAAQLDKKNPSVSEDTNEKFKISTFDVLKQKLQEVGMKDEDIDKIKIDWKQTIECSKKDIINLKESLTTEKSEEKDKEIVQKFIEQFKIKKEEIKTNTGDELGNLKNQINSIKEKNEKGLQKAFELLKNNEIKDKASRNLMLNFIMSQFIYSNNLCILSQKDGLSVVNQKGGEINEKYNKIIKENITKEEFDNLTVVNSFMYDVNGKEKNIDELAKKIVNDHNKNFIGQEEKKKIIFPDIIEEKDKPKIIESILNSNLKETEKTFLIAYINDKNSLAKHQDEGVSARDNAQKDPKSLGQHVEKATGEKIPEDLLTKQSLADVVRDPLDFIGKMSGKMSPACVLSLLVLGVWWIFGKPFDGGSKTFATILAVVGSYGVLDSIGLVEKLAKSIEGGTVGKGIDTTGQKLEEAFNWAKSKVGKSWDYLTEEGQKKLTEWHVYNSYKYLGNDLIENDFDNIYSIGVLNISGKSAADFGIKDKNEQKEFKKYMEDLYKKGVEKFGSKEKFKEQTKDKRVKDVINIVYSKESDEKTSSSMEGEVDQELDNEKFSGKKSNTPIPTI